MGAVHDAVSEELRRRGVIRRSNNPGGDLAEHLFCRAFGWQQGPNSMRNADVTGGRDRLQKKASRRSGSSASGGIALSTNRKNRVLRVPATGTATLSGRRQRRSRSQTADLLRGHTTTYTEHDWL